MSLRILVIGGGDVGFHLTKRLSGDHDLTLVERDSGRVKRAAAQLDAMVIEGDAARYSVLKEAGIQKADVCACLTQNDELNLMVCQMARRAGVKTTIARVRNPEYTEADFILPLREMGVDHLIHPERETAQEIHRLIRHSVPSNVIQVADGKLQLTGMRLDEKAEIIGMPLRDVMQKYGATPFRVAAIQRKTTSIIPRGDTVLRKGDQVFLLCPEKSIPEVSRLSGVTRGHVQNVMILGGGLIGQYLARELGRKYNIKIIESNAGKTEQVAELLPDSIVIHGDGTDIDLLAMEGIIEMDAFISVTGSDETNIISTLVARHLQVPRTLALLNNPEYMPITPTIGLDAVVSKELIAVHAVERIIFGQHSATMTLLPGTHIEVMEFVVPHKSKLTRQPLMDIRFPEHALIVGILRDGEAQLTVGSTQLMENDLVIVFALDDAHKEVARLFR